MWLVHILSQSYYAYLPFNICAVSELEGYSTRSVTTQTIFCSGKANGFYILNYNLSGKKPEEIDVEIAASSLDKSDSTDIFTVKSSQISDKISEAVNSYFETSFIPDAQLEFKFEQQTYSKVPVVSRVNLTCAPQYMVTSDITFEPDSVFVYGSKSDLEKITSIKTRNLTLNDLSASTSGIVSLEKIRKLRIVPESVSYSVDVDRYFEYTYKTELSAVNVPSDKELILLPSSIEVSCRLPFAADVESLVEDAHFVVDYLDVTSSRSAKVAPRLEESGEVVYAYSFNPAFVDCVISEAAR